MGLPPILAPIESLLSDSGSTASSWPHTSTQGAGPSGTSRWRIFGVPHSAHAQHLDVCVALAHIPMDNAVRYQVRWPVTGYPDFERQAWRGMAKILFQSTKGIYIGRWIPSF